LYLTGYRKLDTEDIPTGYKATTPSDPYPVKVFNEPKTIPDNKIGQYINEEFNYYMNIYLNIKSFGLPFNNWLDCPHWLLELYHLFQDTEKEYENYLIAKNN
jgi:hypothetical protein